MNFSFLGLHRSVAKLDLFEFCSEIVLTASGSQRFTLDESLEQEYTKIDETQRNHTMFDPFEIADKDFVVTFLKQDGEARTVTGNLFGPDKGATLSSDDQATYLAGLVDNPLVRLYTEAGWRSFIKSNLITINLVETDKRNYK